MIEGIAETLFEYRFLGIFLLSLIANSIPFVGLPYLNVLVLMTPFMESWELAIVAVLSALGATLGKLVIYFLGRGVGHTLPEKSRENLFFFQKLLRRWGILAIFLFAASPLPDDVLYIPLGMAKYKLHHYFLAVLFGKVIVTSYALLAGKIAMDFIEFYTESFELSFAILFLATTIFTIFILKFNWKRFLEGE
jgi:membrane protein DedA with SNARE-associated domain